MNTSATFYLRYERRGIRYKYGDGYLRTGDRNDDINLLYNAWELSTKHQSAIVQHGKDGIRFYYSKMSSGREPPSCCQRWKSILYEKPEGEGFLEYNVKTQELVHNSKSMGSVSLEIFKTMVASMYSGTGSNFILFNTCMERKPALDDELFFDESNKHIIEWLNKLD